jgi:hypothetical protein
MFAIQQHLPRLFNDGVSQIQLTLALLCPSSLPVTPFLRRNALTSVVESNTTLEAVDKFLRSLASMKSRIGENLDVVIKFFKGIACNVEINLITHIYALLGLEKNLTSKFYIAFPRASVIYRLAASASLQISHREVQLHILAAMLRCSSPSALA